MIGGLNFSKNTLTWCVIIKWCYYIRLQKSQKLQNDLIPTPPPPTPFPPSGIKRGRVWKFMIYKKPFVTTKWNKIQGVSACAYKGCFLPMQFPINKFLLNFFALQFIYVLLKDKESLGPHKLFDFVFINCFILFS